MIKVDTRDLFKYERQLKKLSTRGVLFATMFAMNEAAEDARDNAKELVRNQFITRNAWTLGSIQFKKGNTRNLQASVGSKQDYMADQEFGTTKRKKGKEGVPLATGASSGEGRNARPRKKLPVRSNKLRNITLRKRKGKGKKQRNIIAIKEAARSKRKHVYLETSRSKGIYRVTGGKRKPKVELMHDLSHTSVRIKPKPWLGPSVKITIRKIPMFYRRALVAEIRRAQRS